MATSTISTLSLGAAMLSSMNRAQNQLAQLTTEASSGQYADLGLQLGDQSGYELSLRNQTGLLNSLTTSNSLTVVSLQTAQSAIDSMRTTAASVVSTLTSITAGSTSAAATLQNAGVNALQSLISATNTTANGSYLFGGDNSSVAPMADYFSSTTSAAKADIDSAFQSTFGFLPTDPQASTISASDMQSFLSGPFAALFSGSNWTTDWSSASTTDVTSEIAPGQSITTSTDANQAGFQQLAEGYAMLAEFGGSSLSTGAQQAVITAATTAINQGVSSMTTTEAGLGAAQATVTNATTSMSNQLTILQTQLGNLDNVNANTVATQLNSLQTQLETAYQLTDQLQKLSLAQYLPDLLTLETPMFEFSYNEVVDDSRQVMRARERGAMDKVIDMLRAARDRGAKSREAIEGLYYLRRLWAIFLEDLRNPENELPEQLRAGIVSIGIWMNREIDRVLSGQTNDLTPMIEINEIVRDGLK